MELIPFMVVIEMIVLQEAKETIHCMATQEMMLYKAIPAMIK